MQLQQKQRKERLANPYLNGILYRINLEINVCHWIILFLVFDLIIQDTYLKLLSERRLFGRIESFVYLK